MVWYFYLLYFRQFAVIYTVKGFGVVNKAEGNVFLELPCFFYDPIDVDNLILVPLPFLSPSWTSGSSQFSSVAQLCLTLCSPMDCSTPGLPVHHQFPDFTQSHVHRVSDAIQPSHPLSSPSPPAFNLYQHQGLFKWVWELVIDREAWYAAVHGVTKSRTWLSDWTNWKWEMLRL